MGIDGVSGDGRLSCLVHGLAADGHLRPLLPLAGALQRAGHDVWLLVEESSREAVEGHGFRVETFRWDGKHPADVDAITALAPHERPRFTFGLFLAGAVAAAKRIIELAEHQRPDVLVRETTAWAAWMAGEVLDVPVATVDFAPLPAGLWDQLAGDLFQDARARVGLGPDADLASLDRWLTIVGGPPGWYSPECFRPTTHLLQPPEDLPGSGPPPPWLEHLGAERPAVYVTLGTVFNETPGVFEMVFEAVADLDADVVATVGRTIDPARFGTLPDHIRVEQFVPQSHLLDRCDAVVAHGGYGSLMGALRCGLPVVSIPLAAGDNHQNAKRVQQLGAGIAVPEAQRSVEAIRDAVRAVLHDPRYRTAAQQLATATATLPPFASAAHLVERLARERRPLVAPAGV